MDRAVTNIFEIRIASAAVVLIERLAPRNPVKRQEPESQNCGPENKVSGKQDVTSEIAVRFTCKPCPLADRFSAFMKERTSENANHEPSYATGDEEHESKPAPEHGSENRAPDTTHEHEEGLDSDHVQITLIAAGVDEVRN